MAADAHGHGGGAKMPAFMWWVIGAVVALFLAIFAIRLVQVEFFGRPYMFETFRGFDSGPSRPPAPASPKIGRQTGVAGNCPAGVKVGQPYQCTSSRTRWCICQ